MWPFFFDYYYIILVLPTLFISIFAQFKVKSTFSKYSQIRSSRRITGKDAAAAILKAKSVNNVAVEPVKGSLSDHYDPRSKKLRLSEPVFSKDSIAALGVAAHEAGHALQDAERYGPLVLRSTLVPMANIGSQFGPILAMIGIFFFEDSPLLPIGILLFGAAVLFYLITLPVEFNASSRALAMLESGNMLTREELAGAKKVLSAAAMTYVASALTAMMSLLRLILLARGRRR